MPSRVWQPRQQAGLVTEKERAELMRDHWKRPWVMPVFTSVLAFLGAIGGYSMSEYSKAKWLEREGKLARYHALIVASRAFLNFPMRVEERAQLTQEFFKERDLCRIYCPDKVVR